VHFIAAERYKKATKNRQITGKICQLHPSYFQMEFKAAWFDACYLVREYII
jgi:hypothetical protein